jgi:hypothetical protein
MYTFWVIISHKTILSVVGGQKWDQDKKLQVAIRSIFTSFQMD